jgi:hypothetical protein
MISAGGCEEVEVLGPELTSEDRFFEDIDDGFMVERQFDLETILGNVSIRRRKHR